MFKQIPRDCGPNCMRSCALAEASTEKSAASDITLVFLSRSPVLITQITHLSHLGHVQAAQQHMSSNV